jgi:hypothetical protein
MKPAREVAVASRTALINLVRGAIKSFGYGPWNGDV